MPLSLSIVYFGCNFVLMPFRSRTIRHCTVPTDSGKGACKKFRMSHGLMLAMSKSVVRSKALPPDGSNSEVRPRSLSSCCKAFLLASSSSFVQHPHAVAQLLSHEEVAEIVLRLAEDAVAINVARVVQLFDKVKHGDPVLLVCLPVGVERILCVEHVLLLVDIAVFVDVQTCETVVEGAGAAEHECGDEGCRLGRHAGEPWQMGRGGDPSDGGLVNSKPLAVARGQGDREQRGRGEPQDTARDEHRPRAITLLRRAAVC
mmetsp:Transcript_42701/g.123431  ORF Transcript_42701/g.123431 Transcript_42701/m.123431 type:complete len:259 (-) Transcript_42701:10-786(-)